VYFSVCFSLTALILWGSFGAHKMNASSPFVRVERATRAPLAQMGYSLCLQPLPISINPSRLGTLSPARWGMFAIHLFRDCLPKLPPRSVPAIALQSTLSNAPTGAKLHMLNTVVNLPMATSGSAATALAAANQAEQLGLTSGFTSGDRQEVMALVNQIYEKLHFLRDLTAEERQALPGMGDKNRGFVLKALEVAMQNPDILPRSFDMERMRQRMDMFDQFYGVTLALLQLQKLSDSTAIALGSDLYEDALKVYRYAKASGQGAALEALLAEMAERFKTGPKPRLTAVPVAEVAIG
jgi:hypothetical protein